MQSEWIHIDNALPSNIRIKCRNNTTRIVKFRFKKLDVDDLQSLYLLYRIGLKTLQTLIHTMTRAGLTSMPIMPWHGAPRFRGPPWAARIF